MPGGLYVYGEPKRSIVAGGLLPRLQKREGGTFRVGETELTSASLAGSFQDGDIVWVNEGSNIVRSVLSRRALVNTLLLTEQCDNRCVFCSQPPNDREDSHLYERAALALGMFDTSEVVGLSGGEPLLDKAKILRLFEILAEWECPTPLHILTNGRAFSDRQFLRQLVDAAAGRDICWGVPLYGYEASLHDELVSASGAFLETFQGLLNAGAHGLKIELRVIPVSRNYEALPRIVEFLATHLSFVDVISVMQLEPKGWGRKNYADLYVPVSDQAPHLVNAIEIARNRDIPIRLFNYPLCLLPEMVRSYAVQSISDWKNYYPEGCDSCSIKSRCGGFFTSAQGRFIEEIKPQ